MVDRKASNRSVFEVSTSGDVEKRSVRAEGVQDDWGSQKEDELTDSVAEAEDNRPGRILKLKSKVGLEVTLDMVGVQVVATETGVAGDNDRWLVCTKRLRVSILGGIGTVRVGIELNEVSRRAIRRFGSLRFEGFCWRRDFMADSIDFELLSSIWPFLS